MDVGGHACAHRFADSLLAAAWVPLSLEQCLDGARLTLSQRTRSSARKIWEIDNGIGCFESHHRAGFWTCRQSSTDYGARARRCASIHGVGLTVAFRANVQASKAVKGKAAGPGRGRGRKSNATADMDMTGDDNEEDDATGRLEEGIAIGSTHEEGDANDEEQGDA